jgi:hypothetical protein
MRTRHIGSADSGKQCCCAYGSLVVDADINSNSDRKKVCVKLHIMTMHGCILLHDDSSRALQPCTLFRGWVLSREVHHNPSNIWPARLGTVCTIQGYNNLSTGVPLQGDYIQILKTNTCQRSLCLGIVPAKTSRSTLRCPCSFGFC